MKTTSIFCFKLKSQNKLLPFFGDELPHSRPLDCHKVNAKRGAQTVPIADFLYIPPVEIVSMQQGSSRRQVIPG